MLLRQLFKNTLRSNAICSICFSFSRRRPLNQNYYKLLEVPYNATPQEIKRSYLKLIKKYHPDVSTNPSQEFIKKINEAYSILSDPEQRKKYDEVHQTDISGDKPQNSSGAAQQPYRSDTFYDQKDQHGQTPEKIPFSRVLLLMFLAGMIITTLMMLVGGEFSENRKKLPANIQPKYGVNAPYTKQQFEEQFKQSLGRLG